MDSLKSMIEGFDRKTLSPVETSVMQSPVSVEKDSRNPQSVASSQLVASFEAMHGRLGNEAWSAPIMKAYSDTLARPGYNSSKNHEYADEPNVLREKVCHLANLIRQSEHRIAYTGAGISTSSGIADYATQANETVSARPLLLTPMEARPTLAHRVLTGLYREGMVKHWVQQNHDGLPQKAGFPQHAMNEIHGAWFDPSNPVVPMSGKLRDDLFESLLRWEQKTDLCIAIGTSLSGMNADRVVTTVAEKAARHGQGGGSALGSVVIGLQQTKLGDMSSLRIFGDIDEVMAMLAEEMNLTPSDERSWTSTCQEEETEESNIFIVPYDEDGCKCDEGRNLDLNVGKHVRITSGPFVGDEGEILGTSRHGHYQIRFFHTVKGTWKAPQVHVLGRWMIEEAELGLLQSFPVVSISCSSVVSD